jgi:hypothetical protein
LIKHRDCVLALTGGTYARSQIEVNIGTETESPREGNDPVGKKRPSDLIQTSR